MPDTMASTVMSSSPGGGTGSSWMTAEFGASNQTAFELRGIEMPGSSNVFTRLPLILEARQTMRSGSLR
jgi:hypothetical protein